MAKDIMNNARLCKDFWGKKIYKHVTIDDVDGKISGEVIVSKSLQEYVLTRGSLTNIEFRTLGPDLVSVNYFKATAEGKRVVIERCLGRIYCDCVYIKADYDGLRGVGTVKIFTDLDTKQTYIIYILN